VPLLIHQLRAAATAAAPTPEAVSKKKSKVRSANRPKVIWLVAFAVFFTALVLWVYSNAAGEHSPDTARSVPTKPHPKPSGPPSHEVAPQVHAPANQPHEYAYDEQPENGAPEASQSSGASGAQPETQHSSGNAQSASAASGGTSPVIPILIAVVVLAAISIGVVLYRQRKTSDSQTRDRVIF
jgi:flagellar basal body-associated protein FliL